MRELLASIAAKFRASVRRNETNSAVEDEIGFHMAEARDELIRSGVPAGEAEYVVRRRFGNVTRVREECREAWVWSLLDTLLRDASYAARVFAKKPGLTAILVLVLAFGIGVNTAIFSVVDCVLLRPLPYSAPDSLYLMTEKVSFKGQVYPDLPVNSGNFRLWSEQAKLMSSIALMDSSSDNLYLRDGNVVRVNGLRTTASLFPLLGVQPYRGRFFAASQDRMGSGLSMVLTYRFWKRQFRGDPSIVGRSVRLNGYDTTVRGILPESFYFPRRAELYTGTTGATAHAVDYFTNFNLQPYQLKPGVEMFNFPAIGRVRENVSAAAAVSELNAIEKQVPSEPGTDLHVRLTPLKDFVVGPTAESIELSLAGAMLLLILVCTNVAGLLLSKSLGRSREVAIRLSIGAGRRDLLRQFFVEGLLLSLVGGTLGTLAAVGAVRLLVSAAPATLPRVDTISVDLRFFLVSLAVSAATGLLVSMVPALRLMRIGPATVLKAAAQNVSESGSRLRAQQMLTAGQVALCTMLLIGACLVGKSFAKVLGANEPLLSDTVLTTEILPPPDRYNDLEKRRKLFSQLTAEAARIPGIQAAGISSALPATGETWVANVGFREYPMLPDHEISANYRFVSPGYTQALAIPLLRGRHMAESDAGHDVALVSRSVADMLPRGAHVIGSHMWWQSPMEGKPVLFEVVGVLDDVRATPDKAAPATIYVPYWEWPPWGSVLTVRTSIAPGTAAEALRRVIRKVDNRLALSEVRSMRHVLDEATASRRYVSELAIVFAASATFLAILGVYGLATVSATQRTREIGIRVAVGARPAQIFQLLILQAALLAGAGVVLGLFLAMSMSRLISPILYETKPLDPMVFGAVSGSLVLAAVLAGCLPARRALRVDPVSALKYE